MNKYFVIYSSDPYLLARLCTDLQMEGYVSDRWNNNDCGGDPFYRGQKPVLAINHYEENRKNLLTFFAFGCSGDPIKITLTSRNYLQTLTKIILEQ